MKKSWSTASFELSTDNDQFRMTDRRSASFERRPQPKTAIELVASAPKLLRTARKVTLLVVQRTQRKPREKRRIPTGDFIIPKHHQIIIVLSILSGFLLFLCVLRVSVFPTRSVFCIGLRAKIALRGSSNSWFHFFSCIGMLATPALWLQIPILLRFSDDCTRVKALMMVCPNGANETTRRKLFQRVVWILTVLVSALIRGENTLHAVLLLANTSTLDLQATISFLLRGQFRSLHRRPLEGIK
jgi:hypothetical protein